jgi:uncharacterized repeat protein (TIGR03803 family)
MAGLAVLILTLSAFAAAQQESTLYVFKGQEDGAFPYASLIADSAGNLYGTTSEGGGSSACGTIDHKPVGCGTVFELSPPAPGGNHWTETVLHIFPGGTTDGAEPSAPLVIDAAGNLYGTTNSGGASNLGAIFELSPPSQPGGAWTETVLRSIAIGSPSGLLLDSKGNLYGEGNGYPNSFGTIFELSPPAAPGGAWTYTTLFTFSNPLEGIEPVGGLVWDEAGNLYGTAASGGNGSGPGCPGGNNCGLVFKLVKPETEGAAWTERVLYNFTGTNGDAAAPNSGVVFHNGNHLYGTTAYGGNDIGDGTVFELSPSTGGAWTETTLYQFNRNIGGFRPDAGVIFDGEGNLYGVTYFSFDGDGEVFELSPPAQQGNPWTLTPLSNFNCANNGCYLGASLIFDKGGALYSTASEGGGNGAGVGTVYRVVP